MKHNHPWTPVALVGLLVAAGPVGANHLRRSRPPKFASTRPRRRLRRIHGSPSFTEKAPGSEVRGRQYLFALP